MNNKVEVDAAPPSNAAQSPLPALNGLTSVPCAVGMDQGDRYYGWVFVPHVDGQWVTAAKLEPFSLKIIERWNAAQTSATPVVPQAAGDAVQVQDLSRITSILASEIECSIFERHVQPALDVARKALAKDEPPGAIAWMVIGHYTELFTDLEEASKYALTIGMEVTPLYAACRQESK